MDVPFPASAFRDRVQLYRLSSSISPGGGKRPDYSRSGGPLPCRVMRLASRAKDTEVLTQTETQFEISFPARPDGEARDLYAWLGPDGGELARIAVTEAATPRDPQGRLWMAFGVIVQ